MLPLSRIPPEGEWPFADPQNLATFTTAHVMEQGSPILLVVHDDDGAWQFHWGGTIISADCKVVCLKEVFLLDPSIAEVADLPLGWQAERAAAGRPWTRSPRPPDADDDAT